MKKETASEDTSVAGTADGDEAAYSSERVAPPKPDSSLTLRWLTEHWGGAPSLDAASASGSQSAGAASEQSAQAGPHHLSLSPSPFTAP